jgi:hypothetical protein
MNLDDPGAGVDTFAGAGGKQLGVLPSILRVDQMVSLYGSPQR